MARVLRFYRDFCETAPDEATSMAVCGIIPDEGELFPVAIHGRPVVMLGALFVGPVDEGARVLQPLRAIAEPLVDFSGVVPYVEAQQLWDADYPDGMRYYWKSLNLMQLDDGAIARLVDHARRQPSPLTTTDLWHVGGAV
jgi:hypothetical protein